MQTGENIGSSDIGSEDFKFVSNVRAMEICGLQPALWGVSRQLVETEAQIIEIPETDEPPVHADIL